MADDLIKTLKRYVRTKSTDADGELEDLVNACLKELEIAGVYVTSLSDPLAKNAVKLYCKANYGYDEDAERFRAAYNSLRDAMALSGDYKKKGGG